MLDHIKENVAVYLCTTVLFPLAGLGFFAMMDSRHVAQAELKKTEVRAIRREIRKLENYQRLAPNSEYSTSRQAEIAALKDEEKELTE